jgi:hypothetical protein
LPPAEEQPATTLGGRRLRLALRLISASLGWVRAAARRTAHSTWLRFIPGETPRAHALEPLPLRAFTKSFFAAASSAKQKPGQSDGLSGRYAMEQLVDA